MDSIEHHIQALIRLGTQCQFKAGTLILQESELGDAVYFLQQGQVQAFSQSGNGKKITYGTIHEGHYFGEMALDGGSRSASVEAMSDCDCWIIPNDQVLAYAATHSEFALHLLTTAISRARSATDAARDMALLDVYTRLTQILSHEFESNSGVCELTHVQLASQIGASREMVSKLIKDLVRGGYVEVQNRKTILITAFPEKW